MTSFSSSQRIVGIMIDTAENEPYAKMCALFKRQLDITYQVSRCDFEGRFADAWVLLGSSCNSSMAVYSMMPNSDMFWNEVVMVTRSIQEKLVNYCYYTICDAEEAERFKLYPLYRMYHNTRQVGEYGDDKIILEFNGRETLASDPRVREALDLFADKPKRQGKQSWTKLNFNQRLERIINDCNMSGPLLSMGGMFIYPDASEVLHGSLYGCVALSGIFEPGVTKETSREQIRSKLFFIIYLTIELMNETSRYILRTQNIHEFDQDLRNIHKDAIDLLKLKVND